MKECSTCKYAEFGCYDYYGTTQLNWFVDGCKLENIVPETGACEDYEEYISPIDYAEYMYGPER